MAEELLHPDISDESQRTDGGTDAQSQAGDYTGPGETKDGNLPEDIIPLLKDVCLKMVQREKMARLQQVARCQRARLFDRGLQYLNRADENGLYVMGSVTGTPGWKKYDPSSGQNPQLVINIYQAYGKIHVTNFSQSPCGTRFEANSPDVPLQVEAAKEADAMRKIVAKINDQKAIQSDVASYTWTDGVVVFYARNVEDGSKFGVNPDGTPRMYPEIEVGGLLEWKVPITARKFEDWDYAAHFEELSLTMAKSRYAQKREKIKGDSSGGLGGDADLSRQARMSCMEGLSLEKNSGGKYQSGDAATANVTESRFHLRTSAFEELGEEGRQRLLEYFPSGALVKFIGETYVESKDEDMADHVVPYKALKGGGFNVPGLGDILIDPQEWANNLVNNAKDCFDNTVPNKYHDQKVLKSEALANQTNQYGNWIGVEQPPDGSPISNHFYQDQEVNLPPQLITIFENVIGPLAQFLTGLQPAMFGGDMDKAGDTAKGYAQALNQAKALMGLSWAPFKWAWAQVMRQCVKIAAQSYGAGTILQTYVSGVAGKRDLVVVHVDNLKGDFLATPDTDEDYPESTGAKKAVLTGLRMDAAKDPALAAILNHPDNLRLQQAVMGLDGFVIPVTDSWDKQLREQEDMEKQPTLPDPQALQAAVQQFGEGNIPPEVMQQIPRVSSVSVDPFDDNETELACCVWWLNSSVGQDAKRNNPMWYQNVLLHAMAHQKAIQANASTPEGKPPSESINFKDLPLDGQVQLAAKAGLKIQPLPPLALVAPASAQQ